jgi:hypothetical protein
MHSLVENNQAIGREVVACLICSFCVIFFIILISNYAFKRKRRKADKAL